jgi:hypothetical protein
MIHMLLIGRTICVCQYWTWPRWDVPDLGLTDGDISLLRGCSIDIPSIPKA